MSMYTYKSGITEQQQHKYVMVIKCLLGHQKFKVYHMSMEVRTARAYFTTTGEAYPPSFTVLI